MSEQDIIRRISKSNWYCKVKNFEQYKKLMKLCDKANMYWWESCSSCLDFDNAEKWRVLPMWVNSRKALDDEGITYTQIDCYKGSGLEDITNMIF